MASFSNVNDLSALTNMMAQAEEAAEARGGMSGNGIAGKKKGRREHRYSREHRAPQKAGRRRRRRPKETVAPDPDDIWDAEEVDAHDPDFDDDGRVVPTTTFTTSSVSDRKTFSSACRGRPRESNCKFMVLRIKLPGAKLKNIDLNVDKQKIVVQDPTYRLATYLPYPSDDSQGKAQWLPEKEILSVTLPILRSDW